MSASILVRHDYSILRRERAKGCVFQQNAEKVRQRRSRIDQILNGDPAASPTRRRAQTWCSLFVAPYAPEGTPQLPCPLRPCPRNGASLGREVVLATSGRVGEVTAGTGRVRLAAFLSILRESSAIGNLFGTLFSCSPLTAALSE
jgi:hypothetical protein